MPKVKHPDKPYAGRRLDCVVINTALDQDAAAILYKYCPSQRKATGKFLGRLLYEFEARREERQRVTEELSAVHD